MSSRTAQRRALLPLLVAAGSGVVGSAVLGVAFARRVVQWRPHADEHVVSASQSTVTLRDSPKTRHPGVFGIRYANGYALVGDVLDETERTVTREVRELIGALPGTGGVQWEGDVHALPSDIAPYRDVVIAAPGGPAPAWRFGPDTSATWMIHIHGIRATRDNALRTVLAAEAEGISSLVVSFRGDGDAAPTPGRASRLGLDEWEDVEAAIDYAVAHGAERLLLAGWSMGGAIALRLAERSRHRHLIAALVLVGPATDWRAAISAGARQARVPFPEAAARLAAWALSDPLLSRFAGLRHPIALDELDWSIPGRLKVPALVVHSRADRTVPFACSERFAEANPAFVELREAPDADHSWEYNVAPEWFTSVVRAWLRRQR